MLVFIDKLTDTEHIFVDTVMSTCSAKYVLFDYLIQSPPQSGLHKHEFSYIFQNQQYLFTKRSILSF